MAQQRLELVLDDVVDGRPVSPSSVPVGLLSKFADQAGRFIKGGQPDVQLDTLRVSIEEGSYKIVLPSMVLVAGLAADLALLGSANLDGMDAKRAAVVEEWQNDTQKTPTRRYVVVSDPDKPIRIHAGSRFDRHDNATWTAVEKYVQGKVVDLGGKTKPNLHLQLPDGSMITMDTSQEQVLQEEKNLVYREVLVRIHVEQDLTTGKLRNARLIEFADYQPNFDPQAFEAMLTKGRKAWADVPSASQWVEEQRGSA